jgi:ubiquitin-conjugating enzyme E2 variant
MKRQAVQRSEAFRGGIYRTPGLEAGSAAVKTRLELATITACALLLAVEGERAFALATVPGGAALVVLGALGGLVGADLACGLAHWACDTFLHEDTPYVGPAIVAPFREHHHDPLAIVRRPLAEVSSYNCAGAVLLLALGRLADAGPLLAGFLLTLALGIAATNQLHRWAHAPDVPRVVRWAQRLRLVLEPAAHALHHRHGRDAYCVTTGWLNAPLDRLRIFPRLEAVVRACEPSGLRRGMRRGIRPNGLGGRS